MSLITLDTHITDRIRAVGQSTLPLWIFLASYGMWGFAIFGVCLVGSGTASLDELAVPIALTHALTLGLQQIIRRERPPLAVSKIVMWERTPSFPSAHSATSMACAMVLSPFVVSLGTVGIMLIVGAFALAFGVAVSRVMVGVHYVGDILGGIIFGFLLMLLWSPW